MAGLHSIVEESWRESRLVLQIQEKFKMVITMDHNQWDGFNGLAHLKVMNT
jgi:hypothetical protein